MSAPTITAQNKPFDDFLQTLKLTVADYADAKNLPENYLRDAWGLHDSHAGIIIPYRIADGTLFRNKLRRTLSHKDSDDKPFTTWIGKSRTDLNTIPYGLDHIKSNNTVFLLIEGESDTQTAHFHGISAVGISGADGWLDEFAKLPAFANATTIYIVQEPGEGGEKFVTKLAKSPIRDKCKVIALPAKDISELHLQNPDHAAFRAALKKATDAAHPLPSPVETKPEIVVNSARAARNAATFEGYLSAAGIKAKRKPYERGDFRYKWILRRCPFNSEHRGTSAAMFMLMDGTFKFKCQHKTCTNNKWPQFGDYLAKKIGKPIAFEESRPVPPRSTKQPKKSAENGTDNSSTRTLTFTRGDQVKMRKVSWLWKGRLVAEGLNSFSGEPGVGKSTVAADTIAAITRGKNFSDGALNELGPKDVLIICDEEGREDTIVPRLTLAGADLTRVWFLDIEIHQGQTVEQAGTRLDEDLPLIEEKLREHPDIVLIVPDPVTEYFGNANPNSDQEVGPIYTKMLQASKRHHVAWLLISHFNKDRQATSTNRNSGAKVMVTKPRCNWLFAADPNSTDGRCLMLQGKCNLAKRKALAYYIETQNVATEDVGVPLVLENITRIRWDGETGDQADDVLLSMSDPKERADTKVKAFLDDVLAEGPKRATECYDLGEAQGIYEASIQHHYRGIAKMQIPAADGKPAWWWAKTKFELEELRKQLTGGQTTEARPSDDRVLAFLEGMIGDASMPVNLLKSAAKARGLNWEAVRKSHQRHGYESITTDQGKCWRKIPSGSPTDNTPVPFEGEDNNAF